MTQATHVALIRGINVGGRNKVPMADLRAALEARGFAGVRTFIQSGNVVLAAPGRSEAEVSDVVVDVLRESFDVDTVVVTVTADTMRAARDRAPRGFGGEPGTYHSDVCFLMPEFTAEDAAPAFGIREGVDTLWKGDGVIYFQRVSAQRTKSKLSAVMSAPVYKSMTIRNWATTCALVAMLDDD